jgi:DNA-binding MarR family transcriptional regulator
MARSTVRSIKDSTQQAALQGLRTIIAALGRSARAIEARTGITNAQLFLLQQLHTEGALSINDLATRARTGQSAVSIVVEHLVRRGLVHRRRSAADGRRVVTSLTTAGRALVRRAPESPTARLLIGVARLEDRDLRALARGVNALVGALGVAGEAPAMLFERDAGALARARRDNR